MELLADSAVIVIDLGRSTPARSIDDNTRHTLSNMAVCVRSPTTGSFRRIASRRARPRSDRRIEINPAIAATMQAKMTYHHFDTKLDEFSIIRVGRGNFAWSELKKTTKRGRTKAPSTMMVTTD